MVLLLTNWSLPTPSIWGVTSLWKELPASAHVKNSLDHSLICKKRGFVSLTHNQVRDLEANLISEVCKVVQWEPQLLPLSGETLDLRSTNTAAKARWDISACGIWNTADKTFFDVHVFQPGAESNINAPLLTQPPRDTKKKRKGHITEESLKLRKPLSPHWCSQLLEEWEKKQRNFTNGLPHSLLIKGALLIVMSCHTCVSYVHQALLRVSSRKHPAAQYLYILIKLCIVLQMIINFCCFYQMN
jgi:hypothetical protein